MSLSLRLDHIWIINPIIYFCLIFCRVIFCCKATISKQINKAKSCTTRKMANDSPHVQDLNELLYLKVEFKVKRKLTVQLLRSLADEIQKHHKNANIAKLTGTSASLVGSGLMIGGSIAAFFTFGASLMVTAVGVGITAAGGVTAGGSALVESLLSKSNVKIVQKALDDDRKLVEKIKELLRKINRASEIEQVYFKAGSATMAIASTMKTTATAAYKIGKSASVNGGETLFKTLGNAAKGFHIAGLTLSIVLIPVDVYSLVTTSMDVHKGSIPDVVKDIRKTADDLEAELNQNAFLDHFRERSNDM